MGAAVTKLELFYPRSLSVSEHQRMREVISKKVATYLPSVDNGLVDCGLLVRGLDKVWARTTESGHNFYFEPDTEETSFLWADFPTTKDLEQQIRDCETEEDIRNLGFHFVGHSWNVFPEINGNFHACGWVWERTEDAKTIQAVMWHGGNVTVKTKDTSSEVL